MERRVWEGGTEGGLPNAHWSMGGARARAAAQPAPLAPTLQPRLWPVQVPQGKAAAAAAAPPPPSAAAVLPPPPAEPQAPHAGDGSSGGEVEVAVNRWDKVVEEKERVLRE